MVVERRVIDVESVPDLTSLVEEIREMREPTVLRRQGQEIAILKPIGPRVGSRPKRVVVGGRD